MGCVAASLQHNFRERDVPNSDPSQTSNNIHYVTKSTSEAMGKLKERLPEKYRKDAVIAVEYVMTASPSWFESADDKEKETFFESSKNWLVMKYGNENIIAATVQYDEKTPHLSAFVVPITSDNRLCAKEFIGSRELMREDQTSFATPLEALGLKRGVEGAKSTHQRVKRFYGHLEAKKREIPRLVEEDLRRKKFKMGFLGKLGFTTHQETQEHVVERLNEVIQKKARTLEMKVINAERNEKRVKQLEKRIVYLEETFKPFLKLDCDERQKVICFAKKIKQEREHRLLSKKIKNQKELIR